MTFWLPILSVLKNSLNALWILALLSQMLYKIITRNFKYHLTFSNFSSGQKIILKFEENIQTEQ